MEVKTTMRIALHTCQNGYYQKDKKLQVLVKMWRKGNICYAVRLNRCSHYEENSMEGPLKIKSRVNI